MVLGHEGVLCWGGPEQRAVHKGCRTERRRRQGRRRHRRHDEPREKWAFRRVCRVQHLQKKTRNNPGERQQIQKKDALHHQSWQKHPESLLASTTNHPSLLELSRKDARVDLYGSNLRGTRSFSTTDSAHTTAPTAQHCGKKREVVRRCCSPDFTWRKKEKKETRENVEIFRHNRLFLSVMWHIKINHNNCMNRKVDAFISQ